MRKVYKYVAGGGAQQIPGLRKILCCGMQHGLAMVWVEVDPDETRYDLVTFSIYGTGHPIDDAQAIYVGTAFDGSFVWHVYAHFQDTKG